MSRTGMYKSEPERFSRLWWIDTAKAFVWVAVVTILVWVYADMRFTDHRSVQMTVRLTTGPGSSLTLLKNDVPINSLTQRVEVKLEGSRQTLDRVQGQLAEPIELDVSRDRGTGDSSVSIRDIIAGESLIARTGLRVISTDPASVNVNLGRLVHETVPVVLSISGADLVEQPKVPPVGITLTEQQWRRLQSSPSDVVLNTKQVDLADKEAGKTIDVEFEIFPQIDGVPVRLDKTTVTVPLEIRQRTAKKTVMVTVRPLMLPDWSEAAQYDLVKKDPLEWRPQITVSGSQTDLDKLDAKDIDAYVALREDDKKPTETWIARAVTIRLPSNLLVQLVGEPPQVSFRLDKRPAEPAAP